MKKISVILSVFLLSVVLLFQNCSGMEETSQGYSSVMGLPLHNYFTAQPPASMCGEEGYNFLMDQYLVRHCGACHDNPPLAEPAFAANGDRALSYVGQSLITDERWLASTTDNRFCGENCNLDTRGDMYKALVEWLSCR